MNERADGMDGRGFANHAESDDPLAHSRQRPLAGNRENPLENHNSQQSITVHDPLLAAATSGAGPGAHGPAAASAGTVAPSHYHSQATDPWSLFTPVAPGVNLTASRPEQQQSAMHSLLTIPGGAPAGVPSPSSFPYNAISSQSPFRPGQPAPIAAASPSPSPAAAPGPAQAAPPRRPGPPQAGRTLRPLREAPTFIQRAHAAHRDHLAGILFQLRNVRILYAAAFSHQNQNQTQNHALITETRRAALALLTPTNPGMAEDPAMLAPAAAAAVAARLQALEREVLVMSATLRHVAGAAGRIIWVGAGSRDGAGLGAGGGSIGGDARGADKAAAGGTVPGNSTAGGGGGASGTAAAPASLGGVGGGGGGVLAVAAAVAPQGAARGGAGGSISASITGPRPGFAAGSIRTAAPNTTIHHSSSTRATTLGPGDASTSSQPAAAFLDPALLLPIAPDPLTTPAALPGGNAHSTQASSSAGPSGTSASLYLAGASLGLANASLGFTNTSPTPNLGPQSEGNTAVSAGQHANRPARASALPNQSHDEDENIFPAGPNNNTAIPAAPGNDFDYGLNPPFDPNFLPDYATDQDDEEEDQDKDMGFFTGLHGDGAAHALAEGPDSNLGNAFAHDNNDCGSLELGDLEEDRLVARTQSQHDQFLEEALERYV